jgi:hypothetical protein
MAVAIAERFDKYLDIFGEFIKQFGELQSKCCCAIQLLPPSSFGRTEEFMWILSSSSSFLFPLSLSLSLSLSLLVRATRAK